MHLWCASLGHSGCCHDRSFHRGGSTVEATCPQAHKWSGHVSSPKSLALLIPQMLPFLKDVGIIQGTVVVFGFSYHGKWWHHENWSKSNFGDVQFICSWHVTSPPVRGLDQGWLLLQTHPCFTVAFGIRTWLVWPSSSWIYRVSSHAISPV